MLFSTLITLSSLFGLSLLYLTSASATRHRQHQKRLRKLHLNDGIILNYALTIELLELAFYDAGLWTFNQQSFLDAGYPDPFYSNIEQFRVDEQAHVAFLTEALRAVGLSPTAAQSHYNFPFTDVASWVNLASIIEGVGATAYLGLAASLIDKDYLTASVSIYGTEARHTAYLRAADGGQPVPNGFETALPYNEVFSLVLTYIPTYSNTIDLPFQQFPPLNIQCSPYYYEAGRSSIVFSLAFIRAEELGISSTTSIFAIFFSGLMRLPVQVRRTGPTLADYRVDTLPEGVLGQAYVVLSRSDVDVSDEQIIAGPSIIEVYPSGNIPETTKPACG